MHSPTLFRCLHGAFSPEPSEHGFDEGGKHDVGGRLEMQLVRDVKLEPRVSVRVDKGGIGVNERVVGRRGAARTRAL